MEKLKMIRDFFNEITYAKRDQAMLAIPFQESIIDRWKTDYFYVQPKINGVRAIYKKGSFVSLQGNDINSIPHVNEILKHYKLDKEYLDGELYKKGYNLQTIRSIVVRKGIHKNFRKIDYYVFDIIDFNKTFEERYRKLKLLEKTFILSSNIKIVPTYKIYNKDEIWIYLDKFKSQGYEGIIVRNPKSLYKIGKRSTDLLKFKPMKTDKYLVVGVTEEKDIYGNPKNRLGALILADKKDNRFKVGTGPIFTQETRIKLWQKKDELIGKYAIVKYVETTERGIPFQSILIQII